MSSAGAQRGFLILFSEYFLFDSLFFVLSVLFLIGFTILLEGILYAAIPLFLDLT